MSNVINKTTLEYKKSVNTPDYPETEWIINPDMSEVEGAIPQKYWKIDGDVVKEMDLSEKKVVDDAIKNAKEISIDEFRFGIKELSEALITLGIVTKKQLIDTIKNKL